MSRTELQVLFQESRVLMISLRLMDSLGELSLTDISVDILTSSSIETCSPFCSIMVGCAIEGILGRKIYLDVRQSKKVKSRTKMN